jgi:hypothetical protein
MEGTAACRLGKAQDRIGASGPSRWHRCMDSLAAVELTPVFSFQGNMLNLTLLHQTDPHDTITIGIPVMAITAGDVTQAMEILLDMALVQNGGADGN